MKKRIIVGATGASGLPLLSITIAGVLGSIDIPRGDERNTGQG